jgi:hypothetical protein
LVKYLIVTALMTEGVPLLPAGIADWDEMNREAASASGSGGMSGNGQVPAQAASLSFLLEKRLVFQQRAATPRVRMAGFSHERLKTFSMIRSAKQAVTGGSTSQNPAFLTNCPTTTPAAHSNFR